MKQTVTKLAMCFAIQVPIVACGGGGGGATTTSVAPPSSQPAPSPTPAQPPVPQTLLGRALVWHDEFDQDGLPDPTKWDYQTERNQVGWYNHELQYYTRARLENARVEGGHLVITARNERLSTAPDFGGQNYTSARLVTLGKAAWTYGVVEVRAKLPCGLGTWPAIWMLGTGGQWPDDGEIDLMEQKGTAPSDKAAVLGTVHTKAYNWSGGTLGVAKGAATALPTACTDFNTYRLTWDQDHIQIGVNGVNYFEFANPKNGNTDQWPFMAPQYLLLNLAIGGDLGGAVDDSQLPQQMEVDYVRVYQ